MCLIAPGCLSEMLGAVVVERGLPPRVLCVSKGTGIGEDVSIQWPGISSHGTRGDSAAAPA